MINDDNIIKELEKNLRSFSSDPKIQNTGKVEKNTDGIITISGLSKAVVGEQIAFSGDIKGLVLGLDEDYVSAVLLSEGSSIKEGRRATRTGKILSVRASEELLGRTINPLGEPLDGKGNIKKGKDMPLERIAAGVVDRQPVDTPLKTGITSIDAMFPIGRGQRELIIGDRGLGKTAIALDTMINQKNKFLGHKRVICIYVAIGQKLTSVARVINKLKETDAFSYSIVIAAGASDPAALWYLAPYAGAAIAEYFMQKGEDVLIVYDDLTKHAWAYRQLSLVLKRPAGREAYPGDIFYLHSRLLERAVRLNEKNGGGSITALPIIETQAGDVSAYIPTNVISITDGQIFLESDLFNAGIRPAINVGISVSRVGGAAQTGTMKSVAGRMKLDLAQYRELAAFSQFGSELDQATKNLLDRGARVTEILKQPQYHPLSEVDEILSIWFVTNGFLDDVELANCQKYLEAYLKYMKKQDKEVIKSLESGKKINDTLHNQIAKASKEFKKSFSL